MRFIGLLLACLALTARAATPTTDLSDLWYNANEEGWGVTITQQNDILFVTLFVYGPNNQPKWYVGPATLFIGTTSTGAVTFSGPLYEATGPYFGAPVFNEAAVAPTLVGNVSFTAGQISTGTLSYTVNNVPVTKTVTRQTWRVENLSGIYVGASIGINSGCGSADGYTEAPVSLTIAHDGAAAISIREQGANYECNYQGTYTQAGRMGQITGTGTCTRGAVTQFFATEVQGGIQGLTLRYGASFGGNCSITGRMGGVRRP